jgi:hypothetical protein
MVGVVALVGILFLKIESATAAEGQGGRQMMTSLQHFSKTCSLKLRNPFGPEPRKT